MDNQNIETKKCKYCQVDIPKKAKICPNCKKKQSHNVMWIIIGIVVLFIFVGLFGNNNSSIESNTDTVEENNKAVTTVVDNKADESGGKAYSDSDFEVKEYLYENTIGDTLYFLVVKNNSNANVSVSGNATAKDSSGNAIGAGDMSIDVLGAGETSIGYFYFDSVSGIDSVDYKLKYSDNLYYSPVIGNLEIEQTVNDKNVIVTVTNKGEKAAQFVQAYALFFDENNDVLRYESTYITDDDYEIKIGDTLSGQLDCYKGYDHVEVYFTGRANK